MNETRRALTSHPALGLAPRAYGVAWPDKLSPTARTERAEELAVSREGEVGPHDTRAQHDENPDDDRCPSMRFEPMLSASPALPRMREATFP
jgi:hypothetical protein